MRLDNFPGSFYLIPTASEGMNPVTAPRKASPKAPVRRHANRPPPISPPIVVAQGVSASGQVWRFWSG